MNSRGSKDIDDLRDRFRHWTVTITVVSQRQFLCKDSEMTYRTIDTVQLIWEGKILTIQ